MNAIGPVTRRELSTPGRASATTTTRSSACSPAPATTRSAPAATSRPRSPASSSCRSTPEERAAHARGERPGDPRPDALDRPGQADDRGGQRRRLRGRAGVGVLDRPLRRRRARDVRRHLPALEHRPGRRRHPAAAADRRLPRRDGADRHRPRDRRARGAADRARQRGRPERDVPRAGARARARDRRPPPAGDPHRQGGRRPRLRPAARGGPADRGRVLRPLLDDAGDGRGPAPLQRARPPRPGGRRRRDAGAAPGRARGG